MKDSEAIELLRQGVPPTHQPRQWADLGCGSGTFTKALTHLFAAHSHIYAVDTMIDALNEIPNELNECRIEKIQLDFINDKLPFINLDGLLMANSLHYVKDKLSFFSNVNVYLKSRHQLLVVEYDTDRANRWVPFPISFRSLEQVMHESGYKSIIKLSERPSVYGHGNIYSAAIFKN